MAKRLTKRVVDLTHPGSADLFVWDTDLKGFGLKVTPTGRKSFVAQYRHREDGRTRRVTIGSYGALTVEEARAEARRILGEAATERIQRQSDSELGQGIASGRCWSNS